MGETDARSVEMRRGPDGVQRGELRLVVRNVGSGPVELLLQYYRSDTTGVVTLPGRSNRVQLVDAPVTREGRVEAFGAGSVRGLVLRYTLPRGASPADVDGTLLIQGYRRNRARPTDELTLPLRGVPKGITGTAFEPTKAVLEITHLCLAVVPEWAEGGIRECGDGERNVRLVGRGVSEAIRDLRAAGNTELTVVLQRGDGEQATARLEALRVVSGDPDVAEGRLVIEGDPPAGKYEGALPLSRFVDKPPALTVELRSRFWFPVAVVVIFLGTLLAGWLLHGFGLQRRRATIRNALREKVREYWKHRPVDQANSPIWSLDEVITEGPDLQADSSWRPHHEVKTAAQMGAALRFARDDEDLDEVATNVHLLSQRVSGWLAMETPATGLLAAQGKHHHDRPGEPWASTETVRDTRVLLEAVKREPTDATAVRALNERFTRQVVWHKAVAKTWDRFIFLAGTPIAGKLPSKEFNDLIASPSPAATRTAEEQDRAMDSLRQLNLKLDELEREPGGSTEEVIAAEVSAREALFQKPSSIAGATHLHELDVLAHYADRPLLAFAVMPQLREAEAGPPDGELAPGTGNGGAAPGAEQADAVLAAGADTPEGPLARIRPALAGWLDRRRERLGLSDFRELGLWLLVDRFVTFVVLLLSSVVYGLTVYNDSWGSVADFATAFSAGVAGQVAVKWALLPAYRSLRLRANAAPSSG